MIAGWQLTAQFTTDAGGRTAGIGVQSLFRFSLRLSLPLSYNPFSKSCVAHNQIRTDKLTLTNHVLYQLSNVSFGTLLTFSKTQRTFFTTFGTVHDNTPYRWPYPRNEGTVNRAN